MFKVVYVDNPKPKFPEFSINSCEKCDAVDNVLNGNHTFIQNVP